MFIVDAHLDLAYNALRYGRDLRLELAEAREREKDLRDHPHGTITTTIPELLKSARRPHFRHPLCFARAE